MTREEAIAYGKRAIGLGLNDETQAFCELAIKTLEQKPCEDAVSRASVFEIMGNLLSIPYDFDRNITEKDVSESMDKIRELPRVTPQEPKWIPVTERLPDKEPNKYWVCVDTGYQCECRWTNMNLFGRYETTDWHWNIMDIPQYTRVVAWKTLPKI